MPKADHPDGAETITRAAGLSLAVPACRRQRESSAGMREYCEAINLNRQVEPGVGTT
jgi:hypothetical protein